MNKLILTIYLCVFSILFTCSLKASLEKDKVFVGKNKENYKYFFTSTNYIQDSDMLDKILRKSNLFKKDVKLLVIIEIPTSLTFLEQESMWNKLEKINLALRNYNNIDIKLNGYVNKKISSYKIHLYYR